MKPPRCPSCGAWTVVAFVDPEPVKTREGLTLSIKQMRPLYCPICGFPIARCELEAEANDVIRG